MTEAVVVEEESANLEGIKLSNILGPGPNSNKYFVILSRIENLVCN